MIDSYEIFRKLQEEEKLKKPYKNEDKDSLINIIIEKDNFIEQLQSNWNSLREWLEQQYAIVKSNSIQEPNNSEWYIKWNERKHVLDKMNELEGVDNENNRLS